MPKRYVAFVAGLVCFCAALGPAAAEIGPAEEARLAAGEVLLDVVRADDADVAQVLAVVDIDAPPDTVWAIMTDCARAPRFVPNLVSCKILDRDPAGAWDIREHKVDWAWFMPTVTNVFRSDYEGMRRLRFHRVGGDLKEAAGEWRLEPLRSDQATRVFYTSRLAPNGWVPTGMVRAQMNEDIPKVLTALRRECVAASKK